MKAYRARLTWVLMVVLGPAAHAQSLSFETADRLCQLEARPIVVFLHTDWCRYCEGMKQTSLQDEEVQRLLADQFYFVSFNGESSQPIAFRGKSFQYHATGAHTGVHELALALGEINGQLSYPVTVVISPENELLFQYSGFLRAKQLRGILRRLGS